MNTISLVKNGSLFTYVAPLNLLAWILHPLRYLVPFKKFIRINRLAVKITHFPILLVIFLYERQLLQNSILRENERLGQEQTPRPATLAAMQKPRDTDTAEPTIFSPVARRLRRRESMGSQMQAKVLEEVFRKPFRPLTATTAGEAEGNDVDSWMNGVADATPSNPFAHRRRLFKRGRGKDGPPPIRGYGSISRDMSAARSALSDPEDFAATTGAYRNPLGEAEYPGMRTDDDADNEENSADEQDADETVDETLEENERPLETVPEASGSSETRAGSANSGLSESVGGKPSPRPTPTQTTTHTHARRTRPTRHHIRTDSVQTVIHRPLPNALDSDSSTNSTTKRPPRRTGTKTPAAGITTPGPKPRARSTVAIPPRQNPVFPGSAPDVGLRHPTDEYGRPARRRSISDMSDLLAGGGAGNVQLPSSFATQMAMATTGRSSADSMLNQLLLARMGTLEQSVLDLKDMLKEKKTKGKDNRRPESG